MRIGALIIGILSFASICNASMHDDDKYVNKSRNVTLDEIEFLADGMFLSRDAYNQVRLARLENDGDNYYAFWYIDFVCGECTAVYKENPGVCEKCGSTDIRERELDLFPIG